MHLTNYAINKGNENYEKNIADDADGVGEGSKRTLQWFFDWLEDEGHDPDEVSAFFGVDLGACAGAGAGAGAPTPRLRMTSVHPNHASRTALGQNGGPHYQNAHIGAARPRAPVPLVHSR